MSAFTIGELVERLNHSEHYRVRFAQVFNSPVSAESIAHALADYQRTLLPYDTDFERFMRGDYAALTDQHV